MMRLFRKCHNCDKEITAGNSWGWRIWTGKIVEVCAACYDKLMADNDGMN